MRGASFVYFVMHDALHDGPGPDGEGHYSEHVGLRSASTSKSKQLAHAEIDVHAPPPPSHCQHNVCQHCIGALAAVRHEAFP